MYTKDVNDRNVGQWNDDFCFRQIGYACQTDAGMVSVLKHYEEQISTCAGPEHQLPVWKVSCKVHYRDFPL